MEEVQVTTLTTKTPERALETLTDQQMKEFIYFKESSNRLEAVNYLGCKGIGQDCNGQLEIDCPNWRTDYNCQDQFFTRYMLSRYGDWATAYRFWLNNNWW